MCIRDRTLGRLSAYRRPADPRLATLMFKRIVGVPGDTILLKDYLAYIRAAGSDVFAEEGQLVEVNYEVVTGPRPEFEQKVPFGGDMDELTLGAGEYFVLGDNRRDSSDSRSWGPVDLGRIVGRAFLRYAPIRELESY